MIENLTYKTKFYSIVFIFMLLLLIVYKLNIKKTLALRNEYIEVKTSIKSGKDSPERLLMLENKLTDLNSLLGSSISHSDLHEEIIHSIIGRPETEMMKIWEFPTSYIYSDGNMLIYTNQLTLTGDFKSLIKYLYLLETTERVSRIRSVNFKLKKMRGTHNEKLYGEILLQNIEIAHN